MNLKPSEAQIAAGNYEKKHEKFQGLNISIETPKGAERRGIGKDGNPWSVKMPHDYGYIKRTEGADGDQVDVYIGHHKKSPHVFVVDQHDADSGEFDEHKVMLGFANAQQATRAYDRGFSDGSGPDRRRALLHMGMEDFKKWLAAGNAKKSVKGFAKGGRVNRADGGRMPWENPEEAGGNPWDRPAAEKKNTMGALKAGLIGATKGASANFHDEMEGLVAASGYPSWMPRLGFITDLPAMAIGAGRSALSDESRKVYEKKRDAIRAEQKQAEEEHPYASFAGELVGSLLLPVGKVGTIGQAARAGAGYGLASGVGEGEGIADSAVKGGVGMMGGAALGSVAPKLGEYAGKAADWAGDKFQQAIAPMRRMTDPENQALPFFLEKMKKDVDAGNALTQEQLDFARKYGLPIVGGDLGGEEVRSLARWAGDTSPAARDKINNVLNERHLDEASRLSAGVENLTLAPNARDARAAFKKAAEVANEKYYSEAMEKGQWGIQTPIIDQLMTSPSMQEAIQRAGKTFKDMQAAGMTSKAFHMGEDGVPRPTLEFMNQFKIELGDMIDAAKKAGEKSRAKSLTLLKNKMLGELDELIPEYKKARGIAAELFGVRDASEAGAELFRMSSNPKLYDSGLMDNLGKMSSAERGMVASGYLTAMADKIRTEPNSRNIASIILRSNQSRDVAERLLGTRKVGELEMMIDLEKAASRLREAVQGNSATSRLEQAKRLISSELGWAGAGAGFGALTSGNVFDPMNAVYGAGAALSKRGRDKYFANAQKKWADKIAEYIVTNDMTKLRQAAQQMAKNPWAKRDVRKTVERILKTGGTQAPSIAAPLKITVGPRQVPADEEQE